MNNRQQSLTSQCIAMLRFPLIVLVVFIHSQLDNVAVAGRRPLAFGDYPVYDIINQMVVGGLARLAVPLFFVFSGYLFFLGLTSYVTKWQKRLCSVLVPYVVWNIIYFAILAVLQTFTGQSFGKDTPIGDYQWQDWLQIFWNYFAGAPIDAPLWYVRDLMVMFAVSPLLGWLIRRVGVALPMVLAVVYVATEQLAWASVNFDSLFFYAVGAYLAIGRVDFAERCMAFRHYATGVAAVLWTADLLLAFWGKQFAVVSRVYYLVAIVALVGWTATWVSNRGVTVPARLTGATFFIFAYHSFFTLALAKVWMMKVPVSNLSLLAGYVLIPVCVIAAGYAIYLLIYRYFPPLHRVLNGGRR